MTLSGGTTAAMSDEGRVPLTPFTRKMRQYLSQIDDGPVTLTERGEPIAVVVNIARVGWSSASSPVFHPGRPGISGHPG